MEELAPSGKCLAGGAGSSLTSSSGVARKIIVLFGPPGSGKGTQAKLASARCGLTHISTGDMLRQAVAGATDLGRKVREIMELGNLVSDDVVREIVRERLARPDCREGVLLDGFPRTLRQAKDLEVILSESGSWLGVILINVSQDVLRMRLLGRRSCASCGRPYNVYDNPSSRGPSCEVCGGELIRRRDDTEAVVSERLKVYAQQSEPLVVYYKSLGLLHVLDGERDSESIHRDIVKIANSL